MYYTLLFLLLSVVLPLGASAQPSCPVIPLPLHCTKSGQTFMLDGNTVVVVKDPAFRQAAYYLRNQVLRFTGICLSRRKDEGGPRIVIRRSTGSGMQKGAYLLHMDGRRIIIEAKEGDGTFYGAVTLLQLIQHAAIATHAGREAGSLSLDCWNRLEHYFFHRMADSALTMFRRVLA